MQLQPNLAQSIQQLQNPSSFMDEATYLSLQKSLKLQKTEDENKARKWLIDATFTVTVLWLIFVLLIFIAFGQGKLHYSDSVIITFLTTTTANTLAFLIVIFQYLFRGKKKKTDST